jgi:hypothetical protein
VTFGLQIGESGEIVGVKIRSVKLNHSTYLRVPGLIADLIGLDSKDEVTLTMEVRDGQYLLIYAVNREQVAAVQGVEELEKELEIDVPSRDGQYRRPMDLERNRLKTE